MRSPARFGSVAIIAILLAACAAADQPSPATEDGDAIAPVAPDQGSGAASFDRGTTVANAALLDPATIEDAITVIGTGSTTVEPDEAVVFASVSITRDTVAAARDEAARLMSDVIDAVRANGIPDADLQSAMLSLQPVYEYDDGVGTPGGARLVGYRVDHGLRVTVRSLDALAAVIDDAMAAGATGLDGIRFSVADPSAAEAEARRLAVSDARSRAGALADAAGVSLGRVIAIGEAQANPVWPYSYAREADVGSTPIEVGTIEVDVSVQVAWAID